MYLYLNVENVKIKPRNVWKEKMFFFHLYVIDLFITDFIGFSQGFDAKKKILKIIKVKK